MATIDLLYENYEKLAKATAEVDEVNYVLILKYIILLFSFN